MAETENAASSSGKGGSAAAALGFMGDLAGGFGSFLGAADANKAAKDAALQSEMAKAWTQLLGLSALSGGTPDLEKGLLQMRKTLGKLPKTAKKGTQQALAELQGTEQSALQQIMANQTGAKDKFSQKNENWPKTAPQKSRRTW